MEQVNLKDIEDYVNWYKSEFGYYPHIHLDEDIDIVEKTHKKASSKPLGELLTILETEKK